ncbi:demethoxyubiquinone hydroxylase family protein [Hydrogenophaga intermedia]|nr:demethoxyubiquinone hydroxylase family protein [Hydrogenophaga intermedia]
MHACEKGATGVYWGHRLVASLLFRDLIPQLTEMHGHEVEHFAVFGGLMRARGVRPVVVPTLWCAGGIAYGVLTALGGRRAVWRSTAVIEGIVERELTEAARFFKGRDREVHRAIEVILQDELAHKTQGEANSPGEQAVDKFVTPLAKAGAQASKTFAERL